MFLWVKKLFKGWKISSTKKTPSGKKLKWGFKIKRKF